MSEVDASATPNSGNPRKVLGVRHSGLGGHRVLRPRA